jgi:hypothetical protein
MHNNLLHIYLDVFISQKFVFLRNTAEEAPIVILQKFVDISKLKRHHLTHLAIATQQLSEPWHPSECLSLSCGGKAEKSSVGPEAIFVGTP